jgi:3-hydroxyacyl-[acyl-carrier-protein] dehydratase
MTFLSQPEYKGKKTSFISINNALFKRKIVPGDRLEIYAELDSLRRGIAKGRAESFVDGNPACSAEFVIGINDILEQFIPKRK